MCLCARTRMHNANARREHDRVQRAASLFVCVNIYEHIFIQREPNARTRTSHIHTHTHTRAEHSRFDPVERHKCIDADHAVQIYAKQSRLIELDAPRARNDLGIEMNLEGKDAKERAGINLSSSQPPTPRLLAEQRYRINTVLSIGETQGTE